MIGLAIVVLLIGVASAIMRTASREPPIATVGAPKADVVANLAVANQQQDVGEPLAELGAAPMTANQQEPAGRLAR